MRRFLIVLLSVLMISNTVFAEEPANSVEQTEPALSISAESGIIMEANTGKILYEKEADKELPPASVTKVMTLLLIFDAIEEGKITLEDEVVTSEYAASMGGSQVFLEAGEKQTVDTMIKCISVASANDACVAMSELISGTEEAFVAKMNERAAGLGMQHTHFVNCNGLDADGHLTTAHDIALMSRELLTKYPQITDYSTIWTEDITHTTKKGSEQFGLSNTNKLIRQYEYATGLKTGSTSKAKFCLSATARKDKIDMIAVVMAEPDSKTRVKDAIAMLNYGFSKCSVYEDPTITDQTFTANVKKGSKKEVNGKAETDFSYVDTEGISFDTIKKEVVLNECSAPVKKGEVIGSVNYSAGDKTLGEVPIIATEAVEKLTYWRAVTQILDAFVL